MKFFPRSRVVFLFTFVLVSGFVLGWALGSYGSTEKEKIQSEMNYYLLDIYTADAYMTALASSKKYTEFSLDQFIGCALEDQYNRISRRIASLEGKSPKELSHKVIGDTLKVLRESKARTERYWSESGQIDCKKIGWQN